MCMNSTTLIFIVILILLVSNFVLETWIDILNYFQYKKPIPDTVIDVYDPKTLLKQHDYDKANFKLSMLTSSFTCIITFVVLVGKLLPWLDALIIPLVKSEFLRSAIFFGVIGLVSQLISLPFSWYDTFVVEQRFGFNKSSQKIFFLDIIKSLLISVTIGGILLFIIIWFWQYSGTWFWLWSWIIFSSFSLFMVLFYSTLIVPLFNKQIPLEDGELKIAIHAFAQKVGFNVSDIFVLDASKRSSKTNAYFSGWGRKKRIVLYDTLIQKHSTPEIVAILAHEIGHYKHKHTLFGVCLSIAQMGLFLFVFGLFANEPIFTKSLGFLSNSFHSAVIAFAFLIEPISLISGMISSSISRRFEYQADHFVVLNGLGNELAMALKKLSADNLSNINPHPWYVFFNYSHPPLFQRLNALL